MQTTKPFSERTVLSVTTGRLLTRPTEDGNGIEDMYDLLGWMTHDSPYTHQLGRFAEECKPWLERWFPELALANAALPKLDEWIATVVDDSDAGVVMWIAELHMVIPALKESYDVPRIPQDDHIRKDAYDELVERRGTDEGVILVEGE